MPQGGSKHKVARQAGRVEEATQGVASKAAAADEGARAVVAVAIAHI